MREDIQGKIRPVLPGFAQEEGLGPDKRGLRGAPKRWESINQGGREELVLIVDRVRYSALGWDGMTRTRTPGGKSGKLHVRLRRAKGIDQLLLI